MNCLIVSNDNGKKYEVLETSGKYMLLKNQSWMGGCDRFIVAYNMSPDFTTWQHGSYFDTLDQASRYFQEKQNEKENLK
jgi:hypothetical protein